MQRKTLLLICLNLASFSLYAQDVWHKKLPTSTLNASLCKMITDGEHYLISGSYSFTQVDKRGTITGFFRQPNAVPFWNSVRKKADAASGHPYFWVIHRDASPYWNYAFEEYRPGTGFVNKTVFFDSLTAPTTWNRPQVIDLNDSTVVVFGRKYYRKIKHTATGGFVEEWARPLDMPVTAALLHNGVFVIADETGRVITLNEDGNQLWEQNHTMGFRALEAIDDGYIGCGRTPDNKAMIIKLAFDGTEVWSAVTSDADYFDITGVADGGFAATGISDSAKICLLKFDAAGSLVWKQEYERGTGFEVLEETDGGFVVAGRSTPPNVAIHLIKTDATGNTAPVEDAFIQNRRIKTNSIQATLNPSAVLFFDGNDPSFISLSDSNAAIIFSFAPWIGGLNEEGVLHIAVDDFSPGGKSDYRTGMMNTLAHDFKQVWATNREEIDRLKLDFGTDQKLDQPVPFDILNWPARGNPHLSYNLDFTAVTTDPDLLPAPFADANGDGIYNVYDGDYPRIKGEQMVWWVLTDSTEHKRSYGDVLGIDLFISAYAFDCTQNASIDKSLFVEFEAINRSDKTYHDCYAGFFNDPDLGCPLDDNIGSLPDVNASYVYNADDFDGVCAPEVQGFGSEIPVHTTTYLNRSLDQFIYFLNPSAGFPPIGATDPALPIEFFNYLQSRWRDGTPITPEGSGYNPGSILPTVQHAFPDNPADLQGWSMCTANLPYFDRRTVSSHGPFDFAAGDTFDITVAFTLHPDIPHPCPDIFGLVKPVVAQITQWNGDGSLIASTNLPEVVNLPPGQSVSLDATVTGGSYLWSTGATTPEINVAQPGEYSVTVTTATGCPIVENVLVQLGTSVKDPSALVRWELRPNPAKDFVLVECSDCADEPTQAVLRNAQGVVIFNKQVQGRQFGLETKQQSPGFYWLELWQKGRFSGSRKLVLTD